jgi:hypothetical protein
MGFDDVVKVLNRIPIWKRLGEVPSEVDELKRRVGELEEKLGSKWPGDVCKFCGARAARLGHTIGPDAKGCLQQTWHCNECNQDELRLIKPGVS